MYYLYKQIEQKGLYFYIIDRGQYKMLKADSILGRVYDRYSSATRVLYVLYSDRNFAESRIINCVFYFAQIVLVIYLVLWVYAYFSGGNLHDPQHNTSEIVD